MNSGKNMNQNVAAAAPSSPIDKKTHKSEIEKLRRERINGAIDAMKVIILGHKISHGSTLVRADVAEKALEFMKEQQQLLISYKQRIDHLEKEIVKLKQSAAAPATTPSAFGHPNLLPIFMLQYAAALQMASTPPPSTATTSTRLPTQTTPMPPPSSSPPSSSTVPTKCESENGSPKVEEEVDVVGLQNDETFSPETTPKKPIQIHSRKRSRYNGTPESSIANDDSGIFEDGPSSPKKRSGSFAVNDLLK
uniref:BHLH domain-containing protein n=1 Tax=Panagrolaimus davidi TaxID=227884 RepID=A0A914QQX6_9BILA